MLKSAYELYFFIGGFMSKRLTDKQEKFARLVSSGSTITSAYKDVYDVKDTTKPKSIWEQASALASNLKVASRISELSTKSEEDHRMVAISRKQYVLKNLETIIEDNSNRTSDKLTALTLLGKTIGMYSDKIELENTSEHSVEQLEDQLEKKLSELFNSRAS
jgi:hypothetical protein